MHRRSRLYSVDDLIEVESSTETIDGVVPREILERHRPAGVDRCHDLGDAAEDLREMIDDRRVGQAGGWGHRPHPLRPHRNDVRLAIAKKITQPRSRLRRL